jgi:hypothetical protein
MIYSRHSYFFLGVILAVFCVGVFVARPAQAVILNCQGGKNFSIADQQKLIKVAVPIPGVTFNCTNADDGTVNAYIEDLGTYIGGLYKFLSGAIGLFAAIMVFYAGIRWLTAGGNQAHVKSAKETIASSLIAILIVLGSYLLLFTINPKLVNLRPPALTTINRNEQTSANCPTTRTCQSGAQEGVACTEDSDCGGISGSCAWDVDIAANDPLTAVFIGGDLVPGCGKTYTYRNSVGASGQKNTCTGMVCDGSQRCVLGTKNMNGFDFYPDPVNGKELGCADPKFACENVRWEDTDKSMCAAQSVPGAGRCTFMDANWYDLLYRDSCAWAAALTCDSDEDRVGCGACTGVCAGRFGLESICDANSAAEIVYRGDRSADQTKVRAICCKKKSSAEYRCNPGPATFRLY